MEDCIGKNSEKKIDSFRSFWLQVIGLPMLSKLNIVKFIGKLIVNLMV